MRAFLDKKFLLIIFLITSCDQTAEINSNLEDDTEKIVEAIFEVPLKLDDKFKQENNLDNWSEFNRLEYNILVLANSISGYLDNDFNYLSETLNSLANNSDDILGSEFQLYQDRLEIKGRMKLLNIQIQKTNSLWSVNFVSRTSCKMNTHFFEINWKMTYSLNCIRMKISLICFTQITYFFNW